MPRHKYKVGQSVTFSPSRMTFAANAREYTIVRLLPFEGGDLQYRIKCATEPFERTAREGDLADPV